MKFQLISLILMSAPLFVNASTRFSDTTSAVAKQRIVNRLQIKKISDLNFGEASPGDGPKQVLAGVAENNENASFEVSGEPNRMYQIVLPADNSVMMINGGGGPNSEIKIKEFSSFPIRVGTLDTNGNGNIFVGATREAISLKQKVGDYAGQFFVTVVY
jgi:hypothetical protein